MILQRFLGVQWPVHSSVATFWGLDLSTDPKNVLQNHFFAKERQGKNSIHKSCSKWRKIDFSATFGGLRAEFLTNRLCRSFVSWNCSPRKCCKVNFAPLKSSELFWSLSCAIFGFFQCFPPFWSIFDPPQLFLAVFSFFLGSQCHLGAFICLPTTFSSTWSVSLAFRAFLPFTQFPTFHQKCHFRSKFFPDPLLAQASF